MPTKFRHPARRDEITLAVEWNEDGLSFVVIVYNHGKYMKEMFLKNKECQEHAEAEALMRFPDAISVNGISSTAPDFWEATGTLPLV